MGVSKRFEIEPLPNILNKIQLMNTLESQASTSIGCWIVTINTDIHRQLCSHQSIELCEEIYFGSLRTADGFPIKYLAQKVLKQKVERITGVEILEDLVSFSVARSIPIIIAGGKDGDETILTEKMKMKFPHGEFQPIALPHEESAKLAAILNTKIAYSRFTLLLGVGSLKSEEIILNLRKKFPTSIYLGCGAAISFHVGSLKRAPKLVSKMNLEWFWRLMLEPRRLFLRYFLYDLSHLIKLLLVSLVKKPRR